MSWTIMDNAVLWIGHFLIGLAYYLHYYLLVPKEEIDNEINKHLDKNVEYEVAVPLVKNKLFVLVLYLIVGYFNLLFSAKKIFNKLKKKN